jgi:hypothetical protein
MGSPFFLRFSWTLASFTVSGLLLFVQYPSDLPLFPILAEEPIRGEQPECVESKSNAPADQGPKEPEDIWCCQNIDEKQTQVADDIHSQMRVKAFEFLHALVCLSISGLFIFVHFSFLSFSNQIHYQYFTKAERFPENKDAGFL